MKGRILNIVLVLVLATLPMAANAGWSEAQQATSVSLTVQEELGAIPQNSEASSGSFVADLPQLNPWTNPLQSRNENSADQYAVSGAETEALLPSAVQVTTGWHHSCALTHNGAVKCWGSNGQGRLGDGTTINRNTPADVVGLNSGVEEVSGGGSFTCALTQGDDVKCWGANASGQLGDGTTTDRYTPVDVMGLSTGISAIAVGFEHACVLTSNGGVKCWGRNARGQLGDGTFNNRLTPVDVVGLTSGVVAVAARGNHTCALTQMGGVKCWGDNSYGQLGDGTRAMRLTPVGVVGLTSGVTSIAGGSNYTCALTQVGEAKCWGNNSKGQLGDGTTTMRLTPVNVIGMGNEVLAIGAGVNHTCGVTASGAAKCWGSNYHGELGDGTNSDSSTPTQVVGLNFGISAIAPGAHHTCGRTAGGGAKCWGDNFNGELGDGTYIRRSTPVDVVGFRVDALTAVLVASPVSVAADGSTSASVTLGNAPAGRQIRFFSSLPGSWFSPASGAVDGNGQLVTELRSPTPGMTVITARDLTTGATFATSARVTFTAVGGGWQPPTTSGPIAITDVRAQHPLDARYLQGIPVSNRIDVTVDWKGSTPSRVDFILNGVVHSSITGGTSASHSVDMGQDLQAGSNSLRIVAVNAAEQSSLPMDYAPWSTSMPVWMVGLRQAGLASLPVLASGNWGGQASFEMGFHLPPYAFDIGAPGFAVPDGETKLGWEFSGKLSIPLYCAGPFEGSLSAGVEKGFKFLGAKLEGKVTGSLRAEPIGLCVWDVPQGSGSFKVEATRNLYRKPVIVMVAYFNAAVGVFVEQTVVLLHIEELAAKILGEFYIDGKARIQSDSDIALLNNAPYFQFSNLTVGGGLGIEGGYRYKLPVTEIKVWAGADGIARFGRPGPLAWPPTDNWTFDSITLTGEVGAKFRAGWFERQATGSIEWKYPPTALMTASDVNNLTVSGWRLIAHVSTEDYANFRAEPASLQAFAPRAGDVRVPDLTLASTITSVLVSNVYTYTEPALAANPSDDTALLLWVHDDVAKAVGQSHEIAFSRWDGASWSTPALVTNDDRLDGAPQVAWSGDGQGVAVWQRLEDTLPITATFDITTAKKIEIAIATFNPATNAWSSPALLTNNTALDMTPLLARRADGGLLAIWRQNEGGLLNGDTARPDRIMAARYDTSWTAPEVAVDNIPGLVDLAAGYGANTGMIAYTRFITPTGSVTPTLQLFTSTWNGTAWSPPAQLTDDSLGHTDPQVVYNAANQPLLIWLASGELRLRNLTTGSEAALALPAAIGGVDEFRVVQDGAGNLAAVFTAQASQRDLYVAFYDQVHGLWGLPRALTTDRRSEVYPAPALDTTGRLLLGYAATEIVPITRTATISATGQVVSYTLPLEGQTDLMTLSHVFARNLTLADGDLAISDHHPAPGASVTISATVHNTGDLALSGVAVAFYDGDPQAGGSLIDTATLPQPLAAGYTATLTTLYTAPATGGVRTIHAVADPQNQIAEIDESDNQASLAAFGPDLALVGAAVERWGGNDVGLMAWAQNIGTTTSPTTTVAFHWQTITGTLAITDTLPPLAAGVAYTLTTPWNYGSLTAGEYELAAVVNWDGVDFPEVNTENNQALLTLRVGPDLMVSPYYVWLSPTITSTVVITAAVYNVGSTTSQAATAEFYHGDPTNPENLIFSQTVPALAPAGVAYLTGTWRGAPGGSQSVTVWVDRTQAITETSQANNLASGDVTVPFVQQAAVALNPGWNLLTLPLIPASTHTAQSLLDAINGQGGSCSEIDRWYNGGWDAHINGLPFNNFTVEPGKGYFVKCTVTSQWTLHGYAFAGGVPVGLQPGWNLIGVPHPPSGYTAQSLLDAIASQGGVCSEVDRWLNGGWDAHIGGLPFNDFSVEPDEGYFVKCSQASTFTPGTGL